MSVLGTLLLIFLTLAGFCWLSDIPISYVIRRFGPRVRGDLDIAKGYRRIEDEAVGPYCRIERRRPVNVKRRPLPTEPAAVVRAFRVGAKNYPEVADNANAIADYVEGK